MNIKSLFFSLVIGVSSAFSALEPYDKVLAVVDGEIILHSDLMTTVYQLQNYPGFKGLPQTDLELKVLNQLIDDKVLLARAVKDTLSATEAELEQKVDEHLMKLSSSQNMTQEALAQAIKTQMGITVKQFKDQLKIRFKEDISKQKIKQKYIGMQTPTPGEVTEFFKVYKDSLPSEYNSYRLSSLQLKIKINTAHYDSIQSLADSVAKKLTEGTSFEKLAELYSDDEATKFYGGDLGFINKGTLDPVFERKAFNMEQGQYTDKPVRSKLGFHLIKVLAKKDNEIRVAQILFKVEPTADDSLKHLALIDSLKGIATQENFSSLVKTFSDDKLTKNKGGDLGWFALNEIDEKYKSVVEKLKPGQISEKINIDGDYHLFLLADYQAERSMTLEDDWNKIQEFTQSTAANKKLEIFLKDWRKQVYTEIRDPKFK